jgi:hypothetical protein
MILLILFIDVYTCFSYLIRRIGYFSRPYSSSNPIEPTNSPDLNESNLRRDSLEPNPPSISDSTDSPANLSEEGLDSDILTLNYQHSETENNEIQHGIEKQTVLMVIIVLLLNNLFQKHKMITNLLIPLLNLHQIQVTVMRPVIKNKVHLRMYCLFQENEKKIQINEKSFSNC